MREDISEGQPNAAKAFDKDALAVRTGIDRAKNLQFDLQNKLSAQQDKVKVEQTKLPTAKDVFNGKVQYTKELQSRDKYLSLMFGDEKAYMAAHGFDATKFGTVNGVKTKGVAQYRGDYTDDKGKIVYGHLSTQAAHLYGSADGSRVVTNVYVPLDGENIKLGVTPKKGKPLSAKEVFSKNVVTIDEYEKIDGKVVKENGKPIVKNTFDLIYYSELNGLKDVTVVITHINRGKPEIENGRLLLGTTGGAGGSSPDDLQDNHVHIEILKGKWRTVPTLAKRREFQIPLDKLIPKNLETAR